MKIDTEVPGVSHEVSEDGLWIVSRYSTKRGTAESKIGWDDIDTAVLNYVNAARSFEKRIPKLEERLSKLKGDETDNSRLRRIGNWAVITNSGPPLWWYPKPKLRKKDGRWNVGIGWLYWCVEAQQGGAKL